MQDDSLNNYGLVIELPDDGDDEPEYRPQGGHRSHHSHHRKKKKMSKGKKALCIILIILVVLLLLLVISGVVLYHYVFGKLSHDESLRSLSDAELGIASTENGIIRDADDTPDTITILGEPDGNEGSISIGGLPLSELPEEARDLLDRDTTPTVSHLKPSASQIKTFVIYGLDDIDSSDCIIIVAVDPVHEKVKLISVARDSYAYIQSYGGYSKLTYAYHWGGPELALNTLNSNLYLNLRDYVAVDFEQMATLVDLMGGVTITLDENEARYMSSSGQTYYPGENLLDGAAALNYSRMRQSSSTDSDVYRTGRQRKVLIALISRAASLSYTDYPAVIREGMGLCTTSLTNSEILSMCQDVLLGGYSVEQYAMPDDLVEWWGGLIGELYYSVYNKNHASDAIYRVIYEDLYISGYDDSAY